jgi:hypothetical protein
MNFQMISAAISAIVGGLVNKVKKDIATQTTTLTSIVNTARDAVYNMASALLYPGAGVLMAPNTAVPVAITAGNGALGLWTTVIAAGTVTVDYRLVSASLQLATADTVIFEIARLRAGVYTRICQFTKTVAATNVAESEEFLIPAGFKLQSTDAVAVRAFGVAAATVTGVALSYVPCVANPSVAQ